MRRRAGMLMLLMVLRVIAAEAPAPAEAENPVLLKLSRKVSFEFVDTPTEEALMFFVSLTKLNVIVEPDAVAERKSVTLKVKDVPMSEAFQQILKQAGLEMQVGKFAIYVVKKGSPKREESLPLEPVAEWEKALVKNLQVKDTIQFVDLPLSDVLTILSTKSKTNIIVGDPKLRELQVNLPPRELTLEDTLMEVLRMADLHCEFFHDGVLIRKNGAPGVTKLKPYAPASESEKEILKKLQRQVTFEFVDTPLVEAISFLKSLSKMNVVVDPAIPGDITVSLRVQDMKIESALLWIMRLTGTRYMLRNDAFFIHSEGAYSEKPEALSAEQSTMFKKSLADLGSDDFDAREGATKSIRALGNAALPMLEIAAANAKDAESTARIAALISAFPHGLSLAEPQEVTKLLDDAKFSRKVTVDFVETPLAECVRFLNVSGNLNLEWNPKDQELVNLRVQDMEMRNALRWVVRLGGARFLVENGALKVISVRAAK